VFKYFSKIVLSLYRKGFIELFYQTSKMDVISILKFRSVIQVVDCV